MNPELRFKDQDGKDFPDWEEKKIDKVCRIQTGSGNTQDKEDDGIYPFYVRSPIVEHSNKYIFECESVLTVGDGVGVGNVYHYANGKFNCHQRVYAMNEFNGISGKYFYYFFSTHFGARVKSMTAKTSVDSVRKDMIAKMDIQMPNDMKEQSKIATLLSDIDKKIESQATLVEKLKNTKDAMLVKMFPQGESKVPEIRFDGFSGDWEEKKLGSVAEFIKDGTHASYKDSKVGYPLLSAKDIYNNEIHIPADCRIISEEDYKSIFKSYNLENNDILLTIVGTIGRIAIYKIAMPQVAFQRSVAIIRPKKIYDAKFISQYMSIYYFQSELLKRQNKGAQGGIYLGSLSKILVKIPSKKEEQEKIGQFFSNLDKEIEINQQKYEKLCDVKKALLSKLFPTKEDE